MVIIVQCSLGVELLFFLFIANKFRHIVVKVRELEIGIADTSKFLDMVAYPWNTRDIDERKLEITQRDIVIGDIEPYTYLGEYLVLH